jgi:hypothetical protein
MERGPGAAASDTDRVKDVLKSAVNPDHPDTPVYILQNSGLETDSMLSYLADSYVLQQDLGDRFRALDCVPRRYTGFWPRYLYRYNPQHGMAAGNRAALQLSGVPTRP